MSAPTVQNFPKPKSVTGGCLCGSIRYRVDFPDGHDFLQSSGSCQCTQCRRGTGSLFFTAHSIPLKSLTYLTATDALKKFYATPGITRGFCAHCGSFLYWRDESSNTVDLAVGCVDPELLVGEGEEGVGFGFALANMAGANIWCRNEIRGVTDGMVGRERGSRWAERSVDGVKM
ncbi:Uu.00g114950.m01.CDS01 [Anthostomella pinea]|uniref:Uu.00g114950.m01.CDS01 n=1 Tax=Anthostomella pinea TaxID=933095 RepID=A0AAI8VG97_9PEZI|nr:Uu.00g114950.m01.CDS01 [Anthostomella pinea]